MSKILQFYRQRDEYQDLFNKPQSFKAYTERQLDDIAQIKRLPEEQRFAMHVVANILPFRVNQYVVDELIDWTNIPADPIFQLTFPQAGMLEQKDFDQAAQLLRSGADKAVIKQATNHIREKLNPHPAGQKSLNIPTFKNNPLEGMQHKYRETVLFFPSQGQPCHSYCSWRWKLFAVYVPRVRCCVANRH
jgi:L-lysine 2,3-aminomutase